MPEIKRQGQAKRDRAKVKKLTEAINSKQELQAKLAPVTPAEIRDFMANYRKGTFYTLGIFSEVSIARQFKKSHEIYRVLEYHNITTGKTYRNTAAVQEFRDLTGKPEGETWWEYEQGSDQKIAQNRKKPDDKYVPYFYTKNDKDKSFCIARYYLVDTVNNTVEGVTLDSILASDYLTESTKKDLRPKAQVGVNINTGEVVENQARPRVTSFSHVYWMKQGGENPREYGAQFVEAKLNEDFGDIKVYDAFARTGQDLDVLLDQTNNEEYDDFFTEF